jgi:putative transcriptional regulator
MTIQHHPSDVTLAAFAAGTLDQGQRMAIATHVDGCARCRAFVGAMEHVGGDVLDRLPATAMTVGSLARVMRRIDEPVPRPIRVAQPSDLDDIPGLPDVVRRCRAGEWKWIAPGVHLRPIILPHPGPTRVFLLKAAPGTHMLQHSHTDLEMTCVLTGAFSHDGGRFGPGDFDLGDEEVDHRPLVEEGEDCICLVAMRGELRLSGLMGHLMQPFVRL